MYTLYWQVLELEGEKGEWGFKALKQMIKINFKLVRNEMLCGVVSKCLLSVSESVWLVLVSLSLWHTVIPTATSMPCLLSNCVCPADQLPRDDVSVQAAVDVHQERCDQKLLREVHQLHPRLHLHLQTGIDAIPGTRTKGFWPQSSDLYFGSNLKWCELFVIPFKKTTFYQYQFLTTFVLYGQ